MAFMASRYLTDIEVVGPNDEDVMAEQAGAQNRGGQATSSARQPARRPPKGKSNGSGKGGVGPELGVDGGPRSAHEEAAAMALAKAEGLREPSQATYKGMFSIFLRYVHLFKLKEPGWTGEGAPGSGDELDFKIAQQFWEKMRIDHIDAKTTGKGGKEGRDAVYRYRILVRPTGGATIVCGAWITCHAVLGTVS